MKFTKKTIEIVKRSYELFNNYTLNLKNEEIEKICMEYYKYSRDVHKEFNEKYYKEHNIEFDFNEENYQKKYFSQKNEMERMFIAIQIIKWVDEERRNMILNK